MPRRTKWVPSCREKIAFYEGEAIHVIKDDANGRWNLINRLDNAQPPHARSPDGERIVFVDQSVSDLYVINADGSGRRRLAKGVPAPSGSWASFPAWSPDGKKLAFLSYTSWK
jgi:Tol biopolymer transport system component